MPLTASQQKEIENSIWVVNSALKKQGLSYNDDLRQSAIMYMCECLLRFDPAKGVKWTTYAYKNVYLFIKRNNIREYKRAQRECEEIMAENITAPEKSELALREVLALCSPQERVVLRLKLHGYNRNEIGEITNYSLSKVNKYIKSIKFLISCNYEKGG